MDTDTLIAGGAVVGTLGVLYVATKDDGKPKRPPLTNSGAPVDTPGMVLVGERDYVKVYLGQKMEALTKFGVGEFGVPTTPVTPRDYAVNTILAYWTREINRLCGLDGASGPFGGNTLRPVAWDDSGGHFPPSSQIFFHGMVSGRAADAIVKGWQEIRPKLQSAVLDGLGFGQGAGSATFNKPLSLEGARAFWANVSKLSILVDVDRAFPDHSAFLWIALRDSAVELPGAIGDAARKVAEEVGGFAFDLAWSVAKGFIFSPIGLAVIAGAAWLYRAELGAFYRRVKP